MPSLNTVTLMGHLTADPELRFTPSGEKLVNFTLGVNYRDQQGESHGEFFDCQAWRGWAENLCKTAKKGDLVLVQGRLCQETWKDKETGKNRSRVRVRAKRAFHLKVQFEGQVEPEEEGNGADRDSAPF